MNICEAVKQGRETNKAFRQSSWPAETYAYHGMDNHLFVDDGKKRYELSMAVATLLGDDWELDENNPYHGPLELQLK